MPEHDPASPEKPRRAWRAGLARVEGWIGRERFARWKPWIAPVAAFLITLVVGLTLWGKMRRDVWAYYTDGEELRVAVDDEKARPVLWEDPEPQHFDVGDGGGVPANAPGRQLEAAFSADGTMMVVVREDSPEAKSDMYVSHWDGRVWSKLEPITSVNTAANERGPAVSNDGKYLYFASDREGGKGEYDLYLARWNGTEWSAVEALPAAVNSASDELGPALSADGAQLYFSSDRDGEEDIFVSAITAPTEGAKLPEFAAAAAVDSLNSKAADVQAALTKRGDSVFLASDRKRDKKSGFKVFLSRVIGGETLPPEEVDLYIDEGDVTDPAVRMDGFDLLFSADASVAAETSESGYGFRLFRSTTREVIGYTDLSRWEQFKELMGNIAWWILLAIAAFIALIYLLEKWRDITSLFHKCLAGSGVAHLLALLIAMFMLIAREVHEDEEAKYEDIEINIDALAQEELAMESVPEEIEMTDATTDLQSEKMESEFGAPGFEPQDEQAVPAAAATAKEALLVEAQPATSETADQPVTEPTQDASILNELAAATLPEVDAPLLEERDPSEPQTVADTSLDEFKPEQPTTEATKAEPREMADSAVENAAETTEVSDVQPTEPLTEQEKLPEFVEATLPESAPTAQELPVEPPPLESAMLAALPETEFTDPTEAKLEESDPSESKPAETPADIAQEIFDPGEAVPNLETAPATVGETVADSAVNEPTGAEAVPSAELVADSPAGSASASNIAEAAAESAMPASNFEPSPLGDLPETAFVNTGTPQLEEPAAQPAGAPADSSNDEFVPDGAASNLETAQAPGEAIADAAVAAASDVSAVPTGGMVSTSAVIEALPPGIAQSTPVNAMPPSNLAPAAISGLPDVALVDPGAPRLEERGENPGGAPADTSKDNFEPGQSVPNLTTAPAKGSAVADSAVPTSSDASAVPTGGMVATSAVVEARPPGVAESTPVNAMPPANLAPAAISGLPDVALVDPGAPKLEERGDNPGGAPADTSKDNFEPGQSVPKLTTAPAKGGAVADAAVPTSSDASAIPTGGMVATSAVTEARPPESGQSTNANAVPPGSLDPAPLSALPETKLVDPGAPMLEESGRAGGGPPADTAEDLFKPGGVASNVATAQADGKAVADAAVAGPADSAAITGAVRDAAGAAPMVRSDLAAAGLLPNLAVGAMSHDLSEPSPLPALALPGKLEAPRALNPRAMAGLVQKQRGKPGIDTIKRMGGSDGTEGSIGAAMQWLSKNQEADGRWDTRKHGAKVNHDMGGSGLALLCFYGWGERHDVACKYQQNVRRGVDWLISQQKDNGYLGGGSGMMYSHAIATIALCEAYGVTKDQRLRAPAERAIAYTLKAQSPTRGGWRYSPGQDSDTSVTGWQYMALHSARMSGIEVPEVAFEKVRGFLDRMGGGKHGGLYGYQERGKLSRAMVATGMFCRQLDLVPPGDPMMQESARLIKLHPMKSTKPDLYYVYYATLALYQHQGPVWQAWNDKLKQTLPLIQKKTGGEAGSWDPSSSMTSEGGRVVSTALSTLSLEVYYRLLPMYGFRNTEAEPPAKELRK